VLVGNGNYIEPCGVGITGTRLAIPAPDYYSSQICGTLQGERRLAFIRDMTLNIMRSQLSEGHVRGHGAAEVKGKHAGEPL
jgi:hypothetical protein